MLGAGPGVGSRNAGERDYLGAVRRRNGCGGIGGPSPELRVARNAARWVAGGRRRGSAHRLAWCRPASAAVGAAVAGPVAGCLDADLCERDSGLARATGAGGARATDGHTAGDSAFAGARVPPDEHGRDAQPGRTRGAGRRVAGAVLAAGGTEGRTDLGSACGRDLRGALW